MLRFDRGTNIPSILLLNLALLLAILILLPSPSQANFSRSILVINSYSPGYKWTDEVIGGITEAVRKGDKTIRIHHEFMDTKRISDPEYFRLLHEIYHYKFRNTRFDAIITSDNDAFNFMVQYRDELFPGTPVVSCGVNNFVPSQLGGRKLFTGVNEAPDLKASLDLALKLHPKTRNIYIINDTTTTGRAMHKQLVQLIPRYQDRVKFTLLEDLEMSNLLATIQKLPSDSLIFFIFFFRDKTGKIFEYDQSMSMVAEHSPVPIYGVWDFHLGYGLLGGMVTRGYSQGKTAGELVTRILNGEKADDIPFVMNVPNRYMFDYRQLQRFGISEASLPPDSIVINRPPHRYFVSRSVIWGVAAGIGVLVLMIALLVRNVEMKRRRAENLRQLNEELEERVRQRTEDLEKSRATLEQQHHVLQDTYQGLQAETEERIRMMEELRLKDQMLIHQSRMAAMGEMLGNIAHQWRQPLNLLGLKIQELSFSYRLGNFNKELLDENIEKVMEIVCHLSRTIDDFRTFSTPDKQKVQFKVNDVIAKTVSLIGESFRNQGIIIETSTLGDPEIDGYPNEYGQVLLNILMNSRDAFVERKISKPRITVTSWSENNRTEVTVCDNAGGIDQAILDKIFDAYFTTKELGKGTGVGLFMSQTIIEKNMGGRLTVRNTGDGVEFRITV